MSGLLRLLRLGREQPVVGLAVALDELHIKKIAEAIGSPARFFLRLLARPRPAADLPGRKPRFRAAAQKIQDLLLLGVQHTCSIDARAHALKRAEFRSEGIFCVIFP